MTNSIYLPSVWKGWHMPGRFSQGWQDCSVRRARSYPPQRALTPQHLWWRRTQSCPRTGRVLRYPAENMAEPSESHRLALSSLWRIRERERTRMTDEYKESNTPLMSRWHASYQTQPADRCWTSEECHRQQGSCTGRGRVCTAPQMERTSAPPWCKDQGPG